MSVLKTLVHRAHTVSDADSLPEELDYLQAVFRENGYPDWQINKAFSIKTKTQNVENDEDTPAKSVAFPIFVGNLSFKIERILQN